MSREVVRDRQTSTYPENFGVNDNIGAPCTMCIMGERVNEACWRVGVSDTSIGRHSAFPETSECFSACPARCRARKSGLLP